MILALRKLADRSEGQREVRYDQVTGEKVLVNPETGAAEPWPLAGIQIIGDPPEETCLPMDYVAQARSEGWMEIVGESVVHRPGGPEDNPWAKTHTFTQAEEVVIKTVDGDVRYMVSRQPDKYPERKDGEIGFGGEVHWTYDLKLADG